MPRCITALSPVASLLATVSRDLSQSPPGSDMSGLRRPWGPVVRVEAAAGSVLSTVDIDRAGLPEGLAPCRTRPGSHGGPRLSAAFFDMYLNITTGSLVSRTPKPSWLWRPSKPREASTGRRAWRNAPKYLAPVLDCLVPSCHLARPLTLGSGKANCWSQVGVVNLCLFGPWQGQRSDALRLVPALPSTGLRNAQDISLIANNLLLAGLRWMCSASAW